MTGILQRLLAIYLLVCPTVLFALGLGDIRLNSALNEPLSAEIELLGAAQDELASLSAGLASRETFSRYGVEQSSQLGVLEFKVGRSNDGRDVLRVTSREAISDPFLTFLIEVNWSRGKLLREYTLLLDPPVYMPGEQSAASAPVTAPQAQPRTPAQESRSGTIQRPVESSSPAAAGETSSESVSSQPAPATADGTYRVRPNDTLWQIASTLRPGSSSDVNRMMVALYRANPDAFGGNINELRSGAILRVPDSAAVEGIASTDARAEVRRQYADWKANRGAPAESASDSARLRLVTPTERGEGAAGTTPTPAAPAGAGKVRDLENQLAESRRLLELKEAELARLQQQLGQQPVQTTPPATAPEAAQPPAATPAPEAEVPPAAVEPEAAQPPAAEQPAPAAEPPAPAPEAAPAAEQPAAEGSIVDWLIANWYFPLAALLILGGLIFALIRKRQEPDFDTLGRLAAAGADTIEREPPLAREPITARMRTPKQEEDAFLVEESGEHEQPPAFKPAAKTEQARAPRMADPVVVAPELQKADDTLSSETAINLDQGDPLAEADFHMAYGLYDQAADLVRIAIEREPQRRDLKLKLLEIFFVWGNKDAFLQAARQLNETRDQAAAGEWEKIVIMGKQIAPEDPLFARSSLGGGAASAGGVDLSLESGETRMDLDLLGGAANDRSKSDDAIDLDFGGALGQDDGADTGKSEALKEEDAGVDFLLDESTPAEDNSGATTREMTARTQESPTIESQTWRSGSDAPTVESPALRDRASSTIKEKVDAALFRKDSISPDQTAELALDDLGLDLGSLPDADDESLESLEDTAHPRDALEETDHPSDAATMLAGLDDRSRRQMEQASRRGHDDDKTEVASSLRPQDHSPTGTWIIDKNKVDIDATTEMPGASADAMDLDLDSLEKALLSDTVKQPRRGGAPEEQFSSDVFGGEGSNEDLTSTDIDLDIGEARRSHDREPTQTERIPASEMQLPELEPVTMSEVGTKLDLARAYMDMGDPEGARSILDEVLQEGSATQKQEAQRLIESLPG